MKKMVCILFVCLILFAGCSKSRSVRIEDHIWEMNSVQSESEDGAAVAYGPQGSSTLEDAVELDIACEASAGVLTLTNRTNGKTYIGTHSEIQTDPKSVIYEIEIDSKSGYATCAMTEFGDGSARPTLIISVEDYAINFFADTGKITE